MLELLTSQASAGRTYSIAVSRERSLPSASPGGVWTHPLARTPAWEADLRNVAWGRPHH